MRYVLVSALVVVLASLALTAAEPERDISFKWPPTLESFEPRVFGGHGTKIAVQLDRNEHGPAVLYEAAGWQANQENFLPVAAFDHLYLETLYFYGNGKFLGLIQDFNEKGSSLSGKWWKRLPDVPAGTDKIVVQLKTVVWDKRGLTEKQIDHWFTPTWWHFCTVVPTREKYFTRSVMHPVDQDLLGWMKAGGMTCEEAVSVTAVLDYPLGKEKQNPR